MSNEKQAVTVYQPQQVNAPASTGLALPEAMQLGKVLADSGYFGDRLSAAQAVVKIIKGQSLGIDPVSAMQGMEFVQGKLTMSAGLIASLIQRSERYRYDVREHDDEHCVIEFWDMGQRPARSLGTSPYSMDDAKKAGLAGRDMWTKYRRNMLFARALTNGARWYCPAVFNGPVYTPDEMRDTPEPEAAARTYDADTGERQPAPTPLRQSPPKGKPGGGHEQAARAAAVMVAATRPDPLAWQLDTTAVGCQAWHPQHGGCPGSKLSQDKLNLLRPGETLCLKHYADLVTANGVVERRAGEPDAAPADAESALHATGHAIAEGTYSEAADDAPFEPEG